MEGGWDGSDGYPYYIIVTVMPLTLPAGLYNNDHDHNPTHDADDVDVDDEELEEEEENDNDTTANTTQHSMTSRRVDDYMTTNGLTNMANKVTRTFFK